MTSHHHTKKFNFHPLEVSICGLSGSGKTTLIKKLAVQWQGRRFAYVKHDVHGFQMDHVGKDTHQLTEAGASLVAINAPSQQGLTSQNGDLTLNWPQFLNQEFVIIEGYKHFNIPKIVVLDSELEIMSLLQADITTPLAYVGPWSEQKENLGSPYFYRDDIVGIAHLIQNFFAEQIMKRPLFGLILAGGRSQRMGRDKALLSYHDGMTQLEWCYQLLGNYCERVFVSARETQVCENSKYASFSVIPDTFNNMGPLGGILSAMQHDRNAAWLVIAVDLPALTHGTFQTLISKRDPFQFATAFRSLSGEFNEPLCAIYEPKCFAPFLGNLGLGIQCPVKLLNRLPIKLLDQAPSAPDLMNINFPTEYETFKTRRNISL